MLPRTYPDIDCSIARTLEVVGDRWTLLVVRNALVGGMTRFDQFQQSLGIAPNVLTDRLTRLTNAGVLCQRRYRDRPIRFEYVPTDKGRALWPVLAAMITWGDQYYAPNGPPSRLLHDQRDGRLAAALVCTTCSTPVSSDAVVTIERAGATTPAP